MNPIYSSSQFVQLVTVVAGWEDVLASNHIDGNISALVAHSFHNVDLSGNGQGQPPEQRRMVSTYSTHRFSFAHLRASPPLQSLNGCGILESALHLITEHGDGEQTENDRDQTNKNNVNSRMDKRRLVIDQVQIGAMSIQFDWGMFVLNKRNECNDYGVNARHN